MVREPVLIIFAYEMEQEVKGNETPIELLLKELQQHHNLSTNKEELVILDKKANFIYGNEEMAKGVLNKLMKVKI